MYSTLAEQEEAEKIANCTISEIKQKILYVFENFSNKNMWKDFYKKEVAGKTKAVHIDFLNTLLEITEDEEWVATHPKSDLYFKLQSHWQIDRNCS